MAPGTIKRWQGGSEKATTQRWSGGRGRVWRRAAFRVGLVLGLSAWLAQGSWGRPGTPGVATGSRKKAVEKKTGSGEGPRLFAHLLDTVKKKYFQPRRFRPRAMFTSAVREMEAAAPSLLATTTGDTMVLRAGGERLEVPLKETEELVSMERWAFKVAAFVLRYAKGKTTPVELQRVVFGAMLKTFDPHSSYFPPNQFKGIQEKLLGAAAGIGVEIGRLKGKPVIQKVHHGTPAQKAGLKKGDVLLRAGGLELADLPLSLVKKTLRGKKGTRLSLSVSRRGWRRPKVFRLVREVVTIPSVDARDLGDGVGALHISDFKANTPKAFTRELEALKRRGVKGLVLDLRGNWGGIVGAVTSVADRLVDEGVLLESVGRDGQVLKRWSAKKKNTLFRGPVVVLVDAKTASAGEILAGSLKANGRAWVLGERTWGKGTAQEIFHTSDGGAYKITTFQFRVAGAQPLHLVGVTPHVVLRPVGPVPGGLQAFHLFRGDDEARRWAPYGADLSPRASPKREKAPFRKKDKAAAGAPVGQMDPASPAHLQSNLHSLDFLSTPRRKGSQHALPRVLALAKGLVTTLVAAQASKSNVEKGTDPLKQKHLLDAVERWYAKTQRAESERVTRFLEKKGVAWSPVGRGLEGGKGLGDAGLRRGDGDAGAAAGARAGESQPMGRERLDVSLKLSKREAKAGESVEVSMRITNRGKRRLPRAGGVLFAQRAWVDGRELVVGGVAPGESRSAKATLQVPLDVVSHVIRVEVELITHGETTGVRVSRLLKVVGRRRPRFRYSVLLDDLEGGNGNGILEPGERGFLAVLVRNDGGEARHVRVDAVEAKDPVLITKPRVVMDPLKASSWAVAKMPVSFSRRGKGGSVPQQGSVTLVVYDRFLGGHLRATVPVAASFSAFGCKPVRGEAKAVGRATLRQAARDGAASLGSLNPGGSVTLLGRCGSWYRVRLKGGAPAFVYGNELSGVQVEAVKEEEPAAQGGEAGSRKAARDGRPISKDSTSPKKTNTPTTGVSLSYEVVPPRVFLKIGETGKGSVTVSGRVTHSKGVKDLWVATWGLDGGRPRADKVYYSRPAGEGADGDETLRFKTEVDERGGAQMVAVVARSKEGIKAGVRQAFYSNDEPVKSRIRVGDTPSFNGGAKTGRSPKTATKERSGCGCRTDEGSQTGSLWLWLLALAAAMGWVRWRGRAT